MPSSSSVPASAIARWTKPSDALSSASTASALCGVWATARPRVRGDLGVVRPGCEAPASVSRKRRMRMPSASRSSIAARLPRMEDLRSAAVPAVRDDDHVRGDGRLGRLLRRPHVPALRGRPRAAEGRRRPGGLPPPRAEERATRARWRSPTPPRRPRRRARSGRSPTPPTPTRAASRTRTCGRAPRQLGLDVDRFDADRRSEATPPACSATSRTRCAPGATGTPTLFNL